MKTFKLPALFIIISLLLGSAFAKADDMGNTMLWKVQPNESLSALAAKFYPKSKTMQGVFIRKTQQLNKDTQVFAIASTQYPTETQIVIPTLKSLSVRGLGAKKYKRSKKKSVKKSVKKAPTKAAVGGDEGQLVEKKKALDASLVKQNEGLKSLESKVSELKKQLDQAKKAPSKKAVVQTPPAASSKTPPP